MTATATAKESLTATSKFPSTPFAITYSITYKLILSFAIEASVRATRYIPNRS